MLSEKKKNTITTKKKEREREKGNEWNLRKEKGKKNEKKKVSAEMKCHAIC